MPLNCFPKPNILREIHSSSISQQYLLSVLFSRTKISKQPQNHILLLSHQYFAYSHRILKLYPKSQHNTLTSNKGLHSPEGHVSYLPLTLCTKLHNFLILWNNMPSSSPLCQFHNCFSLCLKLHPQIYHLLITNVSRNSQFFMVDSSIYVQTLCNPMDCSPSGFSVHGVSQERILEWVAIPFSRGSSQCRDQIQGPALQEDSLMSEPV